MADQLRGSSSIFPLPTENVRRGWSLRDRDGLRHAPLRDNDEDAWWTPILCDGGINLPGSQTREAVDCPDCIAARKGLS